MLPSPHEALTKTTHSEHVVQQKLKHWNKAACVCLSLCDYDCVSVCLWLTHVHQSAVVEECAKVRSGQREERVKSRQQLSHLRTRHCWADDEITEWVTNETDRHNVAQWQSASENYWSTYHIYSQCTVSDKQPTEQCLLVMPTGEYSINPLMPTVAIWVQL